MVQLLFVHVPLPQSLPWQQVPVTHVPLQHRVPAGHSELLMHETHWPPLQSFPAQSALVQQVTFEVQVPEQHFWFGPHWLSAVQTMHLPDAHTLPPRQSAV